MANKTQITAISDLIGVWKRLNLNSAECHTKIGQLVRDTRKVITADDILRVANKYLQQTQRSIISLEPKK